jgi:hypothetical protein
MLVLPVILGIIIYIPVNQTVRLLAPLLRTDKDNVLPAILTRFADKAAIAGFGGRLKIVPTRLLIANRLRVIASLPLVHLPVPAVKMDKDNVLPAILTRFADKAVLAGFGGRLKIVPARLLIAIRLMAAVLT